MNRSSSSVVMSDPPFADALFNNTKFAWIWLIVLVAVGREPLQVVFEKELAEEGGILMLHSKEPGQHHGKIEHHTRPP